MEWYFGTRVATSWNCTNRCRQWTRREKSCARKSYRQVRTESWPPIWWNLTRSRWRRSSAQCVNFKCDKASPGMTKQTRIGARRISRRWKKCFAHGWSGQEGHYEHDSVEAFELLKLTDNVQCMHCHTFLMSRHVNCQCGRIKRNWRSTDKIGILKEKLMELRKKARIHIIEILGQPFKKETELQLQIPPHRPESPKPQ